MADETPDKLPPDEALLKEIRDNYDYGLSMNQHNLDQGDEDMRALSVDGAWPEKEIEARKDAKRPMGHTDIISPNNDRVINQFNMHARGIKVVEQGETSTEDTATLRESRIRQIEYENDAADAYGVMMQTMVDRGWGILKLSTERISRKSENLRFCIEAVANIKSVVWDPDTRKPNRSDMQWLFHIDKEYDEETFKREFGDEARFVSFTDEHRRIAPRWFHDKKIRVAQYYRVEKQGDSEPPQVRIYLTNGIDILGEPADCVNTTIPFAIGAGREKWEGDSLVIESMTRKMRHPSMMYDFVNASKREAMGTIIKAKLITPVGTTEAFPEWQDPFRTNRVNLRYDRFAEGRDNGEPIHIQSSVDLSMFEMAMQSELRAAQNAIGMSSADQKDRISKSGVAQRQIDQAGDIASYHYVNSANRSIKYILQLVNEGLHVVEDSSRVVGLRESDGSYKKHQLTVMQGQPHPYGHGDDHGLTIETGPGYQSQSDKADDFIESFISKDENLKVRVADLAIKQARLGPLGDQMAERVKPADIAQKEQAEKDGQPVIPPQVQQQIAALSEHSKQLMQMVQEQAKVIDSKMVENQSKKEIEGMRIDAEKIVALAKIDLERLKVEMSRENALIAAKAKTDTATASLESDKRIAAEEHALDWDKTLFGHHSGIQQLGAEQGHEADMQAGDQMHKEGMQGAQLDAAAQQAQMAQDSAGSQ